MNKKTLVLYSKKWFYVKTKFLFVSVATKNVRHTKAILIGYKIKFVFK